MRKMGFSGTWIRLVMQCVMMVSYSILINGTLVGHIQPSRVIRQGDPLSPYLSILCVEALSAQFQQVESIGALGDVPTSPRGMLINHLFFANDSLLFCKATL